MRFLPVNLDALLVELDDLNQTLALLASLKKNPIDGIEELVPAARTILISYRPTIQSFRSLVSIISLRNVDAIIERDDTLITIPVVYDGEDLAEVAEMVGVSTDEIIRRHTEAEYMVAFTGFAPGFAYMTGGHPSLNVPRRQVPRTKLKAGAVGLAGIFSGIYPQASPGGWQIIGTTPSAMWDISRNPPALLQPGYRVRFVEAQPSQTTFVPAPPAAQAFKIETSIPALEVLSPGLQTLFQDLGRSGHAGQGVSASGAMDQRSLKAANRLVGNASNSTCLESVNGGLKLKSRGDNVIAVTGAETSLLLNSAAGTALRVSTNEPVALADGDILTVENPTAGTRCYIAARGGFDVSPILASCSTDTLAMVGPSPVKQGDVLPIRSTTVGGIVDAPYRPEVKLPTSGGEVVLDVVMGPRTDWFTDEAVDLLCQQRWQVTPQSNRVGIRLAGDTPLTRAITSEMVSEGTVRGAIQVPSAGHPVIFLSDHPLTGGYPVIAAIAPYHLDLAGQIPVNAWVRFNPIRPFKPVMREQHHVTHNHNKIEEL